MKNIIFILLITTVSVASAGNLFTGDQPFESKIEYLSRTKDTLGASDSQTVYTKWVPEQRSGWFYYLANNNFTGTGSDSVRMMVYSDEYDYSDSLLGRILVDSIKAANISPVILPVNNGLPGSKHTLKVITTTGSGAQIITNGWNIVRCKPFK